MYLKLFIIFSFFTTSQLSYGLRFYSPEHGRWLNPDPIGVDGGINVYNSVSNNLVNSYSGGLGLIGGMEFMPVYFGENLFVDPWGNAVGIIEISMKEIAGNKKIHYVENPKYAKTLKFYKEYIDNFITDLKKKVNKYSKYNTFENGIKAGTIKWNGKKFNGTLNEYIALLEREKKSFILLQQGKFHKSAIKGAFTHLNKLAKGFNKDYDQVGIAVHGVARIDEGDDGGIEETFENNISIHGRTLNQQKQLIEFLSGKLKDFKSSARIISCGQDGKHYEEISVVFDPRKSAKPAGFKKVDGKYNLTIEFNPLTFEVKKSTSNFE